MGKVLNEKELACELGISFWTARRMRLQEGCPHFTVGSRIFYRLETVLNWLNGQERSKPQSRPETGYGQLRRID